MQPLHRKLTQKSSTMNGAVSLGWIGSEIWWERVVDKSEKGNQGEISRVPSLNSIQMRWKGCLNSLTSILTNFVREINLVMSITHAAHSIVYVRYTS